MKCPLTFRIRERSLVDAVFSAAALICLAFIGGAAQRDARAEERTPGFQRTAWLLQNATVVTAPGETSAETDILLQDGLIRAVGKDLAPPLGTEVVDLHGYFIYPGLIDASTGDLIDPDYKLPKPGARNVNFSRYALASTRPDNRHSLSPAHDVRDALKLSPDSLKKVAADGFTAAHILPTGRVSSGKGALLSMRDAPLREILIVPETGVEFQLFAPRGGVYPSTLMGATAHLRQAFSDARWHDRHRRLYGEGADGVTRPADDDDWDALFDVASGRRAMFWKASSRDDILRVTAFIEQNELPDGPIVLDADEAHRTLDELQAIHARLILNVNYGDEPKVEPESEPVAFKPELKDPAAVQQDKLDRWRERVGGLKRLAEKKIPFAVGSRGLKSRKDILAALRTAIAAGLSERDALAAITTAPADILGVSDRLGTLEPDKFAHLVVTNGPLFAEKTKIRDVFVDGVRQEVNAELKPFSPEGEAPPEGVSVAGTWRLLIDSAGGNVPATLELQQAGKKLNGQFRSEEGDGRLSAGSIDGTKIAFEVSIGAGAREVILKFDGELKDGKLSGKLKPPFGKETGWSGEPQEGPLTAPNPVKITLDAGPDDKKDEQTVASNDPRPVELRADRVRKHYGTGGTVLLENGTIMTGTGQTLPGASILIRDGKIAAVGKDVAAEEGVVTIELNGRYVIPGIIDTHSHTMISGGINEATQSIVPEVRIKDSVNTEDLAEYRALAGGVTAARLLHGSANTIGGQDAVVKLKFGLPARRQILQDAPQGVKFALGENVKARSGRFPNTRLGVEALLQRAFFEAVDYRRHWIEYESAKREGRSQRLPPRRDFRLEALADIVDHQKFIHSHCYRADEILMLLRVADSLGIRVWSLQHVLEGYKIAPEIVAHGASCSTFADWWAYKVEAYDAIPHNAALLHEAGANSVIKSDNDELIRHLYHEAAKSVRYGNMPEHAALQAITRNPARELGLDDRMGTIEVGKDGDVAVFNGHPFQAFSRCEMTIVEGEVYFVREKSPTAMSDAAVARSARPAPLTIPSPEVRNIKPDLAPSPNGRYALVNAHLHPVDAADIPNGTLVISDGRIQALGGELQLSDDLKRVDVKGLHVYPGLIDTGTTLGLTEIGRVTETHDYREIGEIQPDLRAGVAINPDSELLPVARVGGITAILAQSEGGLICGQSSLIRLHGWTAPEMVLDLEFGLRINWPGSRDRDKSVEKLKQFLADARLYDTERNQAEEAKTDVLIDPRFEAMRPYLSGAKPVLIEAHSRRQIVEAVQFAEEEKLKLILTGATDAWKVAEQLAEKQIPVIVGPVMRAPTESYDPFDAPYANPGRLFEAGVKFSIRSDHAANSRNAPLEAAMAVAYGLPEQEALKSVTLAAAEILGLGDELGSLTVGKRATLIITDGSPLQHVTQVHGIFIDGHPYEPASRQTRFYDKYRQRILVVGDTETAVSSTGTDAEQPLTAPQPTQ